MNFQAPTKEECCTNDHFYDTPIQTLLSQTPRKNKTDHMESSTALKVDLPHLVSPAKLRENIFLVLGSVKLQYVQTPVPQRNFGATPLEPEDETNKHMFFIGSKISYDEEEFEEVDSSPFDQRRADSENESDENNEQMDSREFQDQNNEPISPHMKRQFKRVWTEQMEEPNSNTTSSKKCLCNCKKTQCLKLYCDCFREGETCGEGCQCNDCHNLVQFEEERIQVKEALTKRNKEAFDPKVVNNEHSKGCNCKQTHCVKKYCECYQQGLKCGTKCHCEDCQNGSCGEPQLQKKEERFKNTVKKERRMREM